MRDVLSPMGEKDVEMAVSRMTNIPLYYHHLNINLSIKLWKLCCSDVVVFKKHRAIEKERKAKT